MWLAGRFLLDTNIVIALFATDAAVLESVKNADEVLISSVVLGELYYGTIKSGRPTENMERLDTFAAQNVLLACDAETSRHYGTIKSRLRTLGRMIPENYIWIAAIAIQHVLTLVTRDAHFAEVHGLKTITW